MIKDTMRPNGKIKRVQYVRAFRGGTSSMGTPFKKGEPILHLSSSRCTGETFVLLPKEIMETLEIKAEFGHEFWASARPGRWASPKEWSIKLKERYKKLMDRVYGKDHQWGSCKHTHDEHLNFHAKFKELWQKGR